MFNLSFLIPFISVLCLIFLFFFFLKFFFSTTMEGQVSCRVTVESIAFVFSFSEKCWSRKGKWKKTSGKFYSIVCREESSYVFFLRLMNYYNCQRCSMLVSRNARVAFAEFRSEINPIDHRINTNFEGEVSSLCF